MEKDLHHASRIYILFRLVHCFCTCLLCVCFIEMCLINAFLKCSTILGFGSNMVIILAVLILAGAQRNRERYKVTTVS